jgi:UDP-galactopyranose mutase
LHPALLQVTEAASTINACIRIGDDPARDHWSQEMRREVPVLVVGAGFAGSVVAERFAAAGHHVLLIDRRDHIGGNAFDSYDRHGVLIHPYGPHIFHTNSRRIIEYLSRFTDWRFYEHRCCSVVDGKPYPIPINKDSVNRLYGLNLDEAGIKRYLERVREPRNPVLSSEDLALDSVGRDLYEKFYRNYIRKQWGLEPCELSASVAGRIPVRSDSDDRRFQDTYQLMPLGGYTRMFQAMLDHPRIRVELNVNFDDVRNTIRARHIIFTGPIDTYFQCCDGRLPYRSVRFEHEHIPGLERLQTVGTLSYPNDHAYTRVTEFKYLTGQSHSGTSILREYPVAEGEPYYPVPRPENEALYKLYAKRAASETNVTFVGRLAQYRYYNMDQVVGAALAAVRRLLGVERQLAAAQ